MRPSFLWQRIKRSPNPFETNFIKIASVLVQYLIILFERNDKIDYQMLRIQF